MEIVRLPIESWSQYRELRLRALREDPEAFSSSYADSLRQPESFWKTRLAEAERGERSWLLFARQDHKLIGMIGAFVEGDSTETATVVSVYVPREERGQGVSTRLMDEMLRVLSEVPTLKTARLDVNVGQMAAVRVYTRFGFRETGRKPATTGAREPVQQLVIKRELPV